MLDPIWTGNSLPFFIYQATFITLEDFLIAKGRQLGFRDGKIIRIIGYAWTFGWLLYSPPWMYDWHLQAGMGRHRVVKFSVLTPALRFLAKATGVDVLRWIAEKCAIE